MGHRKISIVCLANSILYFKFTVCLMAILVWNLFRSRRQQSTIKGNHSCSQVCKF
uniref:Uncharacterized protein n=1 Tax=Utricularia reniformis TaxID=192314 RepID=A0A1Y0AZS1_9LAMI|nr:hypothetical protein AEK19_MT0418 [Utricularia reniformis]ART30682.1 hypothetical protein AEK19_MT0418 [Utricularia reniformis]